ncbi:MAG: glycosyltransferase family 2 protein [Bacteroidia bacterium]
MLISVVIPNYNREQLIVDAMDSVYAQDYSPIEMIVVDDGSSDSSVEVVNQWISSHNKEGFTSKLIQQENSGGNVARNSGIANSNGDFIAFLDSDDLWDKDKLSKQLAEMLSRDGIGAVYCGLRHVEYPANTIIEDANRRYPQGELLAEMLVKDSTSPTSCYLIRKEVFEKVGPFDTVLQARQDWDMWIRISAEYRIHAVKEVLVSYRHHEGERTASNPLKEIDAYRSIRSKYIGHYKRLPFLKRQKANGAYYKRMGRVHFHQKISTRKALWYYLRAILSYPLDFDAFAAMMGVFFPKNLRRNIHLAWNKLFAKTRLAIRSH